MSLKETADERGSSLCRWGRSAQDHLLTSLPVKRVNNL